MGQQLDLVRGSVRLFTRVLPVAGAALAFASESFRGPTLTTWWTVLCAVSVLNAYLVRRQRRRRGDVIAHTRARAHSMVVLVFLQLAVWSSVVFWMWHPGPNHHLNHTLVGFVLAATLAGVSATTAFHAATAVAPIGLLSAAVLLSPFFGDYGGSHALIAFTTIYVVLMLGHATAIYRRTERMLRLQKQRGILIQNLRLAKIDSDQARKRAVEASRAKSEFLANMSHELRTPLNAIIGFSDIIRTNAFGDSSDKYKEYGGFIHQSGHRLLELISDILDLAKIEAGRKVLNAEPIDLGGLIADAAAGAHARGLEKGVAVACEVARNLPLLRGDLRAVRQIVDNLLSNSVKFTSEGGSVKISATLSPARELTVAVADDGIGIPVEEQPYIFDRFGRTEPQVRVFNHGVGLGLPIVKGLVDMHEGRIVLESELGEGTTVTVIFPPSATIETPNLRVA